MVPRADGRTYPLALRAIYEAESRIQEIAIVNAHKAPELLATFNIAYLKVKEHIVQLELMLCDAKQKLATRKSILTLDEVPRILKEKGLFVEKNPGGNEDQRQAIFNVDPEYIKNQDRVDIIKAMISLLDGKKDGLEWAYTSVKKILGGETNWADMNQNRNLSAPSQHPTTVGQTYDPTSPRSKFGGS